MIKKVILISLVSWPILCTTAGAATDNLQAIDGFRADYYLDKDNNGTSVLSVEEGITVKFSDTGISPGVFVRSIPAKYLNNSNAVVLTGVSDATGNPVTYKTDYDKGHQNLIVTIGNPLVNLYGDQNFFIHYQAKGVINFLDNYQQFYPNFNGRGWDVPFNALSATIHIPDKLAKDFLNQPVCVIDNGRCEVDVSKTTSETKYIVKSLSPLPAHQSLTAKISFKKGTFKPYSPNQGVSNLKKAGLIAVGVLVILTGLALARSTVPRIRGKVLKH